MLGPALARLGHGPRRVAEGLNDAGVGRRARPEHRVRGVDGLRRRQNDLRRQVVPWPQLLPAGVKALKQALLALRMVEQPCLGERAGRVYGRLDLPVLGGSCTTTQGKIIDVSRAVGLDRQLGDSGIGSLRAQDLIPGDEVLHIIAKDPRSACRP